MTEETKEEKLAKVQKRLDKIKSDLKKPQPGRNARDVKVSNDGREFIVDLSENHTAVVTRYLGPSDGPIRVPEEVEERHITYKVIAIGNYAFRNNTNRRS